MKKTIKLLSVLLLLNACKSENERRIVGKWQATQLMECDNIIPIHAELVGIEFLSNGKYTFNSTLNIKEEGNYRIKKNYLFTQDKLRDKAPEKAVLIQSIDDDTLVLQMNYKGKDQWLTLVKENTIPKIQEKEDTSRQTLTADLGAIPDDTAKLAMSNNAADSIKKVETEKKKQEEAEADKKREAEADRKREAAKKEDKGLSASEAYKKREAKRKADERKAKEEAEKKAEQFRKEYAKREAAKKKKH